MNRGKSYYLHLKHKYERLNNRDAVMGIDEVLEDMKKQEKQKSIDDYENMD